MATINVVVKCSTGDKFAVDVDPKILVSEFKAQLSDKAKIPAAQQRLIFSGHVLKDPQTLESYSLKDGSTIHLVRGGGPAATPSTPSTPTPTTTSSTPSSTTPAGSETPASNQGFDFMGGMFPGMGMGAGGSLEQMMQNPAVMRDIMNSPMMQNLMQNPEIIRSVLSSNPQIREIIERNPEVGHLLNDPQVLRQTMEMARNPELMREMMRNTDRAMSNIESHPEGFNLLRQMYTNVQEPMMNAATQQAQAAAGMFPPSATQPTAGTTPATPSPNPNTAPLPNPWAPPSPSPAGGAAGATPSTGGAAAGTGAANPFMDFGFGNLGGLGGFGGAGTGAGAGGGGGGLGGNFGGFPGADPSSFANLLQNPGIQAMMQQMLSNPELMQQMFEANPMARQMMDANPQMRQMLQNPEFIRQMTNPQNLQAMFQMQQAMRQLSGDGQGGLLNFLGGAGMDWGNLFGAGGGGGSPFGGAAGTTGTTGTQQQQQPQQPPEERFREQLQQLQEMGFTDQQANINALLASGGFVQGAIERLLNS